ncbi:MAG: shikimate kinase AroK [bacterium]|nr:shikimate kinase AroK [bacterium]
MAVVYLCGLPGSGKSTIGALLAELRSQPFYDLDTLIVERAGMNIPAIFHALGEEKFRDFESVSLVQAASRGDSVIALGGGALERIDNRDVISASGLMVYLEAPLELLAARTLADTSRPLLDPNHSLQERITALNFLLMRRREFFDEAPLSFPTTDPDPKQTALAIFEAIDGLV